ncbi:DoxX family protein [Paraburkholderia acidisoli]|uniref:DoxX family membrane protein n=1 Tax=Paraburkholderia acidisoli TaxID=2571748 RepID=A0A7Z2GND1_9BURK|nr:DoxX family protein [Paraburkholderia acidisoli]QGZ64967.1 DoxX family membrane protein [Paraburkholderia acidisoli]
MKRYDATDFALLFLRVSASVLVLIVHGLPKALHWHAQLGAIEDPLHLGSVFTLAFAVFAEVVCPLLMIAGVVTRLAALPILVVTAVALVLVHPDWSIAQGQFAWMLLVMFGTVAIGGAGRIRVDSGRLIDRMSDRSNDRTERA